MGPAVDGGGFQAHKKNAEPSCIFRERLYLLSMRRADTAYRYTNTGSTSMAL